MRNRTLLGLIPAVLLTACFSTLAAAPNEEERGLLSTKMVNLSGAVDIYFADLSGAPNDSDMVLLQNATSHDKRLMAKEFEPYLLKTQYQNPYAVLLLCSSDGTKAIMEDAGCSARIDRQITNSAPCEFTLRVKRGCVVDGSDPQ